jgi:hypothetical protein
MRKLEIEIYDPNEKLPANGDVVLAWTYLLTAERCKFLNGKFHIGNGERWVESALTGVKFWAELPEIPELAW